MKIFLTTPSLHESENVSGISSVARMIINHKGIDITPVQIGRRDGDSHFASLKIFFRSFLNLTFKDYDILHSNTALNPKAIIRDLTIISVAKLRGKKILLHLHGGRYLDTSPNFFLKYLIQSLLFMSHRVITLSPLEMDKLKEIYNFHNSGFIYNCTESFSTETTPTSKTLRIFFAGRLVAEKGLNEIISFAQQYGHEYEITIAGKGDLSDTLLECQKSNKLKFVGALTRQEVLDNLQKTDILLLPSRAEGLPMIVIEAMSCGVVPVVSAVGSLPHIIKNGQNGIILENISPSDIYKSCILLSEKLSIDEIKKNALKFSIDNFSINTFHSKIQNEYTDLYNG